MCCLVAQCDLDRRKSYLCGNVWRTLTTCSLNFWRLLSWRCPVPNLEIKAFYADLIAGVWVKLNFFPFDTPNQPSSFPMNDFIRNFSASSFLANFSKLTTNYYGRSHKRKGRKEGRNCVGCTATPANLRKSSRNKDVEEKEADWLHQEREISLTALLVSRSGRRRRKYVDAPDPKVSKQV